MRQFMLTGVIALITGFAVLAQPVWKPVKSVVTFTIRNAGFNVDGTLGGFAGQLLFDPAAPDKAQLVATVETATLSTGNNLRDGHLKKPDYFDVARYPRISLKSVRIMKKEGSSYVGTFDLTLKGVTRSVQIPFTFVQQGASGTFAGQFTIDRLDYGVGKKSFLLGNEVHVDLKIDGQIGAKTTE